VLYQLSYSRVTFNICCQWGAFYWLLPNCQRQFAKK